MVYHRLTLQSRPHVSIQKQPAKAETQQLQARLSSLGFLLLDVGGGGNCQFRAFAHQLLGDPKQHTTMRQEAVKYIENYRERYMYVLDTCRED